MSNLQERCSVDKGTYPDGPVLTADVSELFDRIAELEAARFAYASEFDGDVGSIHENIRALKAKVAELEAVHEEAAYKIGIALLDNSILSASYPKEK